MKARTAILLPGLHGGGSHFRALVSEFRKKGIKALCFDLPAVPEFGLEDYVAWLKKKLPKNGSYLLIAESFSSLIALSFASQNPKGLAGLVLLGGFPRFPKNILFRWAAAHMIPLPYGHLPFFWAAKWVLLGSHGEAGLVRRLRQETLDSGSAVLTRRIQIVGKADLRGELGRIRVPVLALRGRQDFLIDRSSERDLKAIPRLKIVDIKAPHMLAATNAGDCAQAVEKYF